jgi:hypothetical protein
LSAWISANEGANFLDLAAILFAGGILFFIILFVFLTKLRENGVRNQFKKKSCDPSAEA